MLLVIALYLLPYFLLVAPAYWFARRRGRAYDRSDLLALLPPVALYIGLEALRTRQGINGFAVTLLIGAVVTVCVLLRGSPRLSPWRWALVTCSAGALTALVAWYTISHAYLPVDLPL